MGRPICIVLLLLFTTVSILAQDTECLLELEEIAQSGLLGRSVSCEDDGSYSPVQCTGTLCYCAHEHTGEKLLVSGEKKYEANIWETADMKCGCAREEEEIVLSGVIGRSVSCEDNGNYSPVQCTGSVCYCVHPYTGEQLKNGDMLYEANIWDTADMKCGCAREEEEIAQSGLLGRSVSCDNNGNYSPVQCSGTVCYCAHAHTGEQLSNGDVQYEVNIWESADMTCACAQELQEIIESGRIGRTVSCEADGSYSPVQCTGSRCFCAHTQTGEQISQQTVGIWEFDSLNC